MEDLIRSVINDAINLDDKESGQLSIRRANIHEYFYKYYSGTMDMTNKFNNLYKNNNNQEKSKIVHLLREKRKNDVVYHMFVDNSYSFSNYKSFEVFYLYLVTEFIPTIELEYDYKKAKNVKEKANVVYERYEQDSDVIEAQKRKETEKANERAAAYERKIIYDPDNVFGAAYANDKDKKKKKKKKGGAESKTSSWNAGKSKKYRKTKTRKTRRKRTRRNRR